MTAADSPDLGPFKTWARERLQLARDRQQAARDGLAALLAKGTPQAEAMLRHVHDVAHQNAAEWVYRAAIEGAEMYEPALGAPGAVILANISADGFGFPADAPLSVARSVGAHDALAAVASKLGGLL